MAIRKNKKADDALGASDLFCNMKGGAAFRITETYKSIRTSLMFTLSGGEDNAILLTSAEPNSGKSVTTANLGLSFAQTGSKVLILDCDMRNPSQHKIYAQENTKGLSNVLCGMCDFEKTVKRGVQENLDILTAGQTPPNPSELLGSDRMRALLEDVKAKYDFVLLDCPPVEVVSDTCALALNVPQAVVVARQNHAIYDEVIHTVETLKSIGAKILGAVLTDVTAKGYSSGSYSKLSYGSRYGHGYGSRYGKYGTIYGYGPSTNQTNRNK